MIFDDLKIANIVDNGELYVRVSDLRQHISNSIDQFAADTEALSHVVRLTDEEKTFIIGLINGMFNIVSMLTQSHDEHKLGQINTIEELLEKFNES